MRKGSYKLTGVILAAGESSRFWPFSEEGHKSLFKIFGKAIIRHTVEALASNGIREVILVHGLNQKDKFEKALKGVGARITYVTQKEPLGTGDALKCAAPYIKGDFVLLNGAHENAKVLLPKLVKLFRGKKLGLLTTQTEKPNQYGIVELDKKDKKRIIGLEERPRNPMSNIKTVGIYLLPNKFLSYLSKVVEGPYSLVIALDQLVKDNNFQEIRVTKETSSIKYSFDILDLIFESTVGLKRKISKKSEIAKGVAIKGNIIIEDGARIKENVVIYGPAFIGKNCVIGANSVVRENSVIENGVEIGVGTEIKRSYIGEGTHIHSGYIGDSIIAENCRIGAGFITANRRLDRKDIKFTVKGQKVDSKKSYLGCVIGANTKIGIRASTMPGTIIGSNCIVGSNTEVKGTVESDMLVYIEQNLKAQSARIRE